MAWYLAPVVVDEGGSVQVGSQGRVHVLPGLVVHIGHTEDNPTQCLVKLPQGVAAPSDWTPVVQENFETMFSQMFGRAPTASERNT